MLTEATRLHLQLFREWDKLARQYRDAVAEISSLESWKKTFEANSEDKS
jgi:galactofuranosylgalactofuranosylrhamnosyl-N-acetylglucosaminyl-diphospho-decaprenol beta-1,5/1,6-galactofuranosyltransferase